MRIQRIFVAGFRHDVQFTRTCVASIRHWYPRIPITLIKDRFYGDYSTHEIERNFCCEVFDSRQKSYGWGFGKFEPLFLQEKMRFLVIDSDIVLAGPVLERLQQFSEDFVVQREVPTADFVVSHYFDPARLKVLDPEFQFPGYTFNTGQWVGTSGLLREVDFDPYLHRESAPRLKQPEIFKLGEQGLLIMFS